MSGPSDTSGRPLASPIQNYQQQPQPQLQLQQQQQQPQQQQQLDTAAILPSSPRIRRRKPSQYSDERISAPKLINSRRHPGTAKEASFGPHTGSSRGQTSMMQRSTMSPSNMSPEAAAVHYTRTGRISKAKKGLKVHNCECGKSYTRAEHLRRHQKNHAQNALICEFPDCGKTFYRLDLLQRHQERHNEIGKDSRQPSIFSPRGTAEESQPSPPAEMPTVMTSIPPTSPYYPQQAISPVPESASNISHSKQRSSYPTRQSIAVPVLADGLQTNIPWSAEPFSQSPNYSSSSGYASPVPSGNDYANIFANPPYGPGPNRTRTSSNASFVEPWTYPSRSPTSATSTMAYTWTSTDKSPAPSNLAYMATSYSMTSVPMAAGVDPLYGHFGPKTMAQRDEGEQAILFPDQAYGMGQLEHTYPFEQYLDNYWRFFHPSFPVVHRATFDGMSQSPMLRAAMIAIGGQYSNDASVKRKSRILHDRCMKLLEQRDLDVVTEPERLCDEQALFLIEVLSQYRARRAANTLSPRFGTVYQRATDNFRFITTQMMTLTQPLNATHEQWTQWIELASRQRLLLCCYILEYQQAIHLARESPQSLIQYSGLDLPFPAHSSMWDATDASDWAIAVQQRAHLPTYVYEVTPNLSPGQLDSFQSSLLIAAYYNHFSNPAPYLAPAVVTNIEHLLDPSPLTKHNLLTAKLLQVTPIRALLAIPGESWVLSGKIHSLQDFNELKTSLRTWISGLWAPLPPVSNNLPAKDALRFAIEILQQAINTSPHTYRLNMGADMGLYFAALVIWAVTVAASTRVNTSSQGTHLRNFGVPPYTPHSSNRTSSHYTPSTPTRPHALLTPNSSASMDLTQSAAIGLVPSQRTSPAPLTPHSTTSTFSHSEAMQASMSFLSTALVELDFLGLIPQWPREVSDWQAGCASLLRWLKTRLRDSTSEGRESVGGAVAGMGTGGDGLGELLDGVVSVLEKVMGRGWEGWGI